MHHLLQFLLILGSRARMAFAIERGRPHWSAKTGATNMDFSTREAFGVREFCARYGICRQTFYDEVKRGRIKAKKLGKKTVILRSDAEKWAASLPALDLAVIA